MTANAMRSSGGVNNKEIPDGDQQGGKAVQLVYLLRSQVTAQIAETGDMVLDVIHNVNDVGTALGTVSAIVPGVNDFHRKRGGDAPTQRFILSSAVVAVAMAAQDLVGFNTYCCKSRHTAVLVWIQHNLVTL